MSHPHTHANDVPAEVPPAGRRRALALLVDSITRVTAAVLPALLLVATLALVVTAAQAFAGTLGLLVVGFALAVGTVVALPFVVVGLVSTLLAL